MVENEQALRGAVASVRASLARLVGEPAEDPADDPAASEPSSPGLDTLSGAFGLSSFERQLVLLCAGIEIDPELARLAAAAQGDHGRPQPTFALALSALAQPHWSALAPAAPLRYWRLVEIEPRGPLVSSPLRIDERILHYLLGMQYLDERLEGLVGPPIEPAELPESHAAVARALAQAWGRRPPGEPWPLITLLGEDQGAKQAVVAVACASLGVQARSIDLDALPSSRTEQEALRRLWTREATLTPSVLYADCSSLPDAEPGKAAGVVAFLDLLQAATVVASRQPVRGVRRPMLRLSLDRPSAEEQRELWRGSLGASVAPLNGRLDELVAQFDLGPAAIAAASIQVAAATRGDAPPGVAVWDACREQARTALDDLAQRIEPAAGWDDLVLPDSQLDLLHDLATHVRHRTQVHERWGFAAKGKRGLGISALFAGASGTGKTMAAEVLAGELRLDLYRIDLSSVVSKYIGETERNLRRVFDAAEEGGALLLFDEADALFGKRTEVKDSHDRYANIEVSYLLQRMEAYRGLAILTTNFRSALDASFLRRLRFVVEFPFPNAAQRAEIWRRIFPTETPTEGLEIDRLARLNVAGGSIRNIALNAAFLAAGADRPVEMGHVMLAARREYAKLERPVTATESGSWERP